MAIITKRKCVQVFAAADSAIRSTRYVKSMKSGRRLLSNEFRRTRSDHANETAEDYVEAIAEISKIEGKCRCADLARRFAVSHVTVVKIIARLEAEGLVRTAPYAPVELTNRGRRLAAASRERHEVVLRFLQVIGVDYETAVADAEGIEHHVSKKTLDCFRRMIKQKDSIRD